MTKLLRGYDLAGLRRGEWGWFVSIEFEHSVGTKRAVFNDQSRTFRAGTLVGQWKIELYDASFPLNPETRVTGSVAIERIESGSALLIRQGVDETRSLATWIIGRDDRGTDYQVLYADDRGVSRVYEMSLAGPDWRIWRTMPEFSQRFEGTLASTGPTIRGSWQKSFDEGTTWEHDFNIDYFRARDTTVKV